MRKAWGVFLVLAFYASVAWSALTTPVPAPAPVPNQHQSIPDTWQERDQFVWYRAVVREGIQFHLHVSVKDRQLWFTARTSVCRQNGHQVQTFYWKRGSLLGMSQSCNQQVNPMTVIPAVVIDLMGELPVGAQLFLDRLRREYVDSVVPSSRI